MRFSERRLVSPKKRKSYQIVGMLSSSRSLEPIVQMCLSSRMLHNNDGNQTGMTDENGHTTQSVFDALSRLTSRTCASP